MAQSDLQPARYIASSRGDWPDIGDDALNALIAHPNFDAAFYPRVLHRTCIRGSAPA